MKNRELPRSLSSIFAQRKESFLDSLQNILKAAGTDLFIQQMFVNQSSEAYVPDRICEIVQNHLNDDREKYVDELVRRLRAFEACFGQSQIKAFEEIGNHLLDQSSTKGKNINETDRGKYMKLLHDEIKKIKTEISTQSTTTCTDLFEITELKKKLDETKKILLINSEAIKNSHHQYIQEMTTFCRQAQNEIREKVHSQNEKNTQILKEAKQEIAETKAKIEEKLLRNKESDSLINSLKHQNEQKDRIIAANTQKIKKGEEEMSKLQQKIYSIESELEFSTSKILEEKKSISETLKNAEDENKKLKFKVSENESKLNAFQQQFDIFKEDARKYKETFPEEMKTELISKISGLSQKNMQIKDKLTDLQNENIQLQQKCHSFSNQIKDKNNLVQKMRENFEQTMICEEERNVKMKKLKEKIKEYEAAMKLLVKKMKQKETQCSKLAKENRETKEALLQTRENLEQTKENLTETSEELESTKDELRNRDVSIEEFKDSLKSSSNKERDLNSAQNKIDQQNTLIKLIEDRNSFLSRNLQLSEEKIHDLTQKIIENSNLLKKTIQENFSLAKKNDSIELLNKKLERELEEAHSKIIDMHSKLLQYENDMVNNSDSIKNLKLNNKRETDEKKMIQQYITNERERYRSEISRLQKVVSEHMAEKTDLLHQIDETIFENKTLKQIAESKENELSFEKKKNLEDMNNIRELTSKALEENKKLKEILQNSDTENKQIISEFQRLIPCDNIKDLVNKVEQILEDNRKKSGSIKELKTIIGITDDSDDNLEEDVFAENPEKNNSAQIPGNSYFNKTGKIRKQVANGSEEANYTNQEKINTTDIKRDNSKYILNGNKKKPDNVKDVVQNLKKERDELHETKNEIKKLFNLKNESNDDDEASESNDENELILELSNVKKEFDQMKNDYLKLQKLCESNDVFRSFAEMKKQIQENSNQKEKINKIIPNRSPFPSKNVNKNEADSDKYDGQYDDGQNENENEDISLKIQNVVEENKQNKDFINKIACIFETSANKEQLIQTLNQIKEKVGLLDKMKDIVHADDIEFLPTIVQKIDNENSDMKKEINSLRDILPNIQNSRRRKPKNQISGDSEFSLKKKEGQKLNDIDNNNVTYTDNRNHDNKQANGNCFSDNSDNSSYEEVEDMTSIVLEAIEENKFLKNQILELAEKNNNKSSTSPSDNSTQNTTNARDVIAQLKTEVEDANKIKIILNKYNDNNDNNEEENSNDFDVIQKLNNLLETEERLQELLKTKDIVSAVKAIVDENELYKKEDEDLTFLLDNNNLQSNQNSCTNANKNMNGTKTSNEQNGNNCMKSNKDFNNINNNEKEHCNEPNKLTKSEKLAELLRRNDQMNNIQKMLPQKSSKKSELLSPDENNEPEVLSPEIQILELINENKRLYKEKSELENLLGIPLENESYNSSGNIGQCDHSLNINESKRSDNENDNSSLDINKSNIDNNVSIDKNNKEIDSIQKDGNRNIKVKNLKEKIDEILKENEELKKMQGEASSSVLLPSNDDFPTKVKDVLEQNRVLLEEKKQLEQLLTKIKKFSFDSSSGYSSSSGDKDLKTRFSEVIDEYAKLKKKQKAIDTILPKDPQDKDSVDKIQELVSQNRSLANEKKVIETLFPRNSEEDDAEDIQTKINKIVDENKLLRKTQKKISRMVPLLNINSGNNSPRSSSPLPNSPKLSSNPSTNIINPDENNINNDNNFFFSSSPEKRIETQIKDMVQQNNKYEKEFRETLSMIPGHFSSLNEGVAHLLNENSKLKQNLKNAKRSLNQPNTHNLIPTGTKKDENNTNLSMTDHQLKQAQNKKTKLNRSKKHNSYNEKINDNMNDNANDINSFVSRNSYNNYSNSNFNSNSFYSNDDDEDGDDFPNLIQTFTKETEQLKLQISEVNSILPGDKTDPVQHRIETLINESNKLKENEEEMRELLADFSDDEEDVKNSVKNLVEKVQNIESILPPIPEGSTQQKDIVSSVLSLINEKAQLEEIQKQANDMIEYYPPTANLVEKVSSVINANNIFKEQQEKISSLVFNQGSLPQMTLENRIIELLTENEELKQTEIEISKIVDNKRLSDTDKSIQERITAILNENAQLLAEKESAQGLLQTINLLPSNDLNMSSSGNLISENNNLSFLSESGNISSPDRIDSKIKTLIDTNQKLEEQINEAINFLPQEVKDLNEGATTTFKEKIKKFVDMYESLKIEKEKVFSLFPQEDSNPDVASTEENSEQQKQQQSQNESKPNFNLTNSVQSMISTISDLKKLLPEEYQNKLKKEINLPEAFQMIMAENFALKNQKVELQTLMSLDSPSSLSENLQRLLAENADLKQRLGRVFAMLPGPPVNMDDVLAQMRLLIENNIEMKQLRSDITRLLNNDLDRKDRFLSQLDRLQSDNLLLQIKNLVDQLTLCKNDTETLEKINKILGNCVSPKYEVENLMKIKEEYIKLSKELFDKLHCETSFDVLQIIDKMQKNLQDSTELTQRLFDAISAPSQSPVRVVFPISEKRKISLMKLVETFRQRLVESTKSVAQIIDRARRSGFNGDKVEDAVHFLEEMAGIAERQKLDENFRLEVEELRELNAKQQKLSEQHRLKFRTKIQEKMKVIQELQDKHTAKADEFIETVEKEKRKVRQLEFLAEREKRVIEELIRVMNGKGADIEFLRGNLTCTEASVLQYAGAIREAILKMQTGGHIVL